ncbi:sensor histidine kinase [Saccharicrinis aurantiacus]|uniref:sensor histidine kinase n=1 Tax=Saccharicrinis aurantiacus TaxID=1849719 RepID=UPI00248FC45A|nr:ATP-binding protein [Saccharicrinis aurantiacus]
MNRLLQRQIKKNLSKELLEDKAIQNLLEAINSSYENYEDQISMTQRAMKISSDELFSANQKLRKEADTNKETIQNIQQIVKTLNLKSTHNPNDNLELTEVATYIKQQSKEIAMVSKEREELLKNLEKRNQVLSEYAHMVSHDLKSPLRNVNSVINWIMDDNKDQIDSTCTSHFELILQNLEKMDSLISGILEYSTIDAVNIKKNLIDIEGLIDDITNKLTIPDETEVRIVGKLPTVEGNQNLFFKLFRNIIDNAVKNIVNKEGLIQIGVIDKNTEWEFYISDNGKGIKPEYHEKIFEIFQKIDDDATATGIGLAIVKRIIDLYCGKIWLQSKVGLNTTFFFTLPK